jgi:peptide methionine sulfoxide reductase MsrB
MVMIYQPDREYFQALAEKIIRLSKCNVEVVERVEINCGNSSHLGCVVLKTGEKIVI